MDSLEYSLLIVMCVNLMLVLGQISSSHVENIGGSLINCQNSPLGQFGSCVNKTSYNFDAGNPILPTSSTSVDATTGGVFTDIWNTIKGFFGDTLGLKYVTMIVSAPSSFLKGMGLDADFSNLVGGVWWVFNVILIISYIKR